MVRWVKGVKNGYLDTFGAKRRRKKNSTILVRKTWILDLWEGGLGGGGCFQARPPGGGWSGTPQGSMGTPQGWGGGLGPPLQRRVGGGSLGHPLPSTFLVRQFSLWREAPEIFFGPFKSTQNPLWGTFEWSNVKIFFGALRQTCKKTLIYGPMG